MKRYTITLNFESPSRCDFGFPKFGTKTVTIIATNQQSLKITLDQMFGKNLYDIIDISEEHLDSTF